MDVKVEPRTVVECIPATFPPDRKARGVLVTFEGGEEVCLRFRCSADLCGLIAAAEVAKTLKVSP